MPEKDSNKIIIRELKRLISKPAIYRDVNLNREFLAQKLGISSTKLSLLVHKEGKTSLLDMINEQRIKHVKRILDAEEHSNDTLEEISLRSGFNNRLTMYRYFVKYYGVTPGDYRKK